MTLDSLLSKNQNHKNLLYCYEWTIFYTLSLIHPPFHAVQSLQHVHSEVLAWQTVFSPGWICQFQVVALFWHTELRCRASHPLDSQVQMRYDAIKKSSTCEETKRNKPRVHTKTNSIKFDQVISSSWNHGQVSHSSLKSSSKTCSAFLALREQMWETTKRAATTRTPVPRARSGRCHQT